MLLGHNLPRDFSFSIAGGSFATSPAALQDRKPGQRTMIVWPGGAQATSTTCAVTATRSAAFVPRVGYLLGTDLPIGLRVELLGKRVADLGYTYALGGNAATQRVVELPDGSRGCWWVLDASLDAIVSTRLVAYNDVGGEVAIDASAEHLIGEFGVCPAVEIIHELGPQHRWVETAGFHRGPAGQVDFKDQVGYRTLSLRGCWEEQEAAWGEALDNGMDWTRLLSALRRDPFTVCVPYPNDTDLAQRNALFGVARGELGFTGGQATLKQLESIRIEEVPSGVPR